MLKVLFLATSVFLFSSCATYRPVLDENSKYLQVGDEQAERDIDSCMTRADAYLEKHKSERMKKEAGRGAVSGAIVGGVFGALTGGGLKSAAGGAAVGAGVGAVSGAGGAAAKDNLTPDEMKQAYVVRCLRRKKYDVIGWK